MAQKEVGRGVKKHAICFKVTPHGFLLEVKIREEKQKHDVICVL